jgi:hypothetical protein
MKIVEATREYEQWADALIPLVRDQIEAKHKAMREDIIEFLRGTFYRWAQLFPSVCADLNSAVPVLAVGDLHVGSYGTWRDAFGRLVWGVDDFDEAYRMPFASDLVRLATSAVLDATESGMRGGVRNTTDLILDGYTAGLKAGGAPYVLEEHHKWLRAIALDHLDKPAVFWKKLDALPTTNKPVPAGVRKAFAKMLPEPKVAYRVARRLAGVGSLGRARYVAIADWLGGRIAIEAKDALPSSYVWATGITDKKIYYEEAMSHARRCPDPCVHLETHWLMRRLSPDSSPIEVEGLARHKDQDHLLHAMAWEAANIHLGTPRVREALLADLRKRRDSSFRKAVKAMAKAVTSDWKDWKKHSR